MGHKFVVSMCVGGHMGYVVAVMYIMCLVVIEYDVTDGSMCGVNSAHEWSRLE